jgi:serine/threonine protein kinase
MRGEPSEKLVSLLGRLQLATAADLTRVVPRVRRLSGDLPDFESVWVDALAQARVLTPYQAAEINAGRGDALLRGRYVLLRPMSGPHYAACFAARQIDDGRRVRMYILRRPRSGVLQITDELARLVQQSRALSGTMACPIEEAGSDGEGPWAVCAAIEGVTAADWMAENGRLSPRAVEHVAREMLERLLELERLGIVHGDIGAAGLLLTESGRVAMPMAGLRALVRPAEGYSFGDLQPEAYDYLAPERIADGAPPTLASDVYACGCLWWHLLTGRPPFAGGNSLAKLRAVHAAKLVAVRNLAPDAPETLVRAISLCLVRDPTQRPRSFARLIDLLGPSTRLGAASLNSALDVAARRRHATVRKRAGRRDKSKRTAIAATLSTMIALTTIGSWQVLRTRAEPGSPIVDARVPRQAPERTSNAPLVVTRPDASARRDATSDEIAAQSDVKLVAANMPIQATHQADLILPTGKKLRPRKLDLRPGQRVVGRDGKRPQVSVPAEGLLVTAEDAIFDGIDFVWENATKAGSKTNLSRAMIALQARGIEFRGCTFACRGEAAAVVVSWQGVADAVAAPAAEITFADCVLSGVASIVDSRGPGGLSVNLHNSLCVDAGSVARLNRAPSGGDALTIVLAHTTIRGDTAVVECRYARVEEHPSAITVSAVECVLDADPESGLVILSGALTPASLLSSIAWNGEGSLVTPRTAMAVWRSGTRKQQPLPDEDLDMAGLVRSAVEFAGPGNGPPRNSRVTRWQGPTRSADPPGAAVHSLPTAVQ